MEQTNEGQVLVGQLQPPISYPSFHFRLRTPIPVIPNWIAFQNHWQSISIYVFVQFLRAQNLRGCGGRQTKHLPCVSTCCVSFSRMRTTTPFVPFPNVGTLVLKPITLYKLPSFKCLPHYSNLIIPTLGPWTIYHLVFTKVIV